MLLKDFVCSPEDPSIMSLMRMGNAKRIAPRQSETTLRGIRFREKFTPRNLSPLPAHYPFANGQAVAIPQLPSSPVCMERPCSGHDIRK